MAYDEDVANRVRELLAGTAGVDERQMFGGLAFLVNGKMTVCVTKDGLMVRVPAEEMPKLLTRNHVEPMVMAGRETRGWILVSPAGLGSRSALQAWVQRGVRHVESLPDKPKRGSRRR